MTSLSLRPFLTIIALGFLSLSCVAQESLSLSTEFPSVEVVLDFALLSEAIYFIRGCNSKHVPSDVTCHHYENSAKSRTEVMVVSSHLKNYVAIVYAGTDNIEDWMHDMDIALTPFGPEGNPIEKDVKVHKGFNKCVFSCGVYDRIHRIVSEILRDHPHYDLVTTGHSLGAADSILTGAAFAKEFPERNIVSYNFGCPRTGEIGWKAYVDRIPNLGVWRYVYEDDIVPRLPGFRFEHTGHTVQFYRRGAYAFYLHGGDDKKHYASVPPLWSSAPFFNPFAFGDHAMENYVRYIKTKSLKKPEKFWVDEFVTTEESLDDNSELLFEPLNEASKSVSDQVQTYHM